MSKAKSYETETVPEYVAPPPDVPAPAAEPAPDEKFAELIAEAHHKLATNSPITLSFVQQMEAALHAWRGTTPEQPK